MNTEMYARNGGKALPEGNLNVVKVINFVDEEGQPVTMGQGPAGPTGPAGPIGPAGPTGPAGPIHKATYVNPETGSISDVVKALIAAGLMASA
nr:MAG: hypothetical protein [Bacteriophage sp.]